MIRGFCNFGGQVQLDLLFHLFGRLSTYVQLVHRLREGAREGGSYARQEGWRNRAHWRPSTMGIRARMRSADRSRIYLCVTY
jgi:hypothetical protein